MVYKAPLSGSSNLLLESINVWSQLTVVCSESDDTVVIWNVYLLFELFLLKNLYSIQQSIITLKFYNDFFSSSLSGSHLETIEKLICLSHFLRTPQRSEGQLRPPSCILFPELNKLA